jgi:hypothetical protein
VVLAGWLSAAAGGSDCLQRHQADKEIIGRTQPGALLLQFTMSQTSNGPTCFHRLGRLVYFPKLILRLSRTYQTLRGCRTIRVEAKIWMFENRF